MIARRTNEEDQHEVTQRQVEATQRAAETAHDEGIHEEIREGIRGLARTRRRYSVDELFRK